jgi:hypothetical protein
MIAAGGGSLKEARDGISHNGNDIDAIIAQLIVIIG